MFCRTERAAVRSPVRVSGLSTEMLFVQMNCPTENCPPLCAITFSRLAPVRLLEHECFLTHKWFFKDTKLYITSSAPITGRCCYLLAFCPKTLVRYRRRIICPLWKVRSQRKERLIDSKQFVVRHRKRFLCLKNSSLASGLLLCLRQRTELL